MHLRFDGYLGYPGGLIDPGETIIEGVSREIKEEIGIDQSDFKLTKQDFVCRMTVPYQKPGRKHKKSHLFFFSKEVSEENFLLMEENSKKAEHFGSEILGNIRVPLYTLPWNEKDGFPAFLTNAFVSVAKLQLFLTLYKNEILTSEEIMKSHKIFSK